MYNTSVPTVPLNFAEKVNGIYFKFIWYFKPDKVKRQTLTLSADKGGFNMVDFKLTVENGSPSFPLLQLNTGVDLSSNAILTRDLNLTSRVPTFYRDILTVWQELHS